MNYAIYEALRIVVEEGLKTRFKRHAPNAAALQAGVQSMGLELAAQQVHRLPQLTAVRVPDGIDDARVRATCYGSSTLKSAPVSASSRAKVWRIGLMGESSRRENVMLALNALETVRPPKEWKSRAAPPW